jgi:hypothetical protein
MFIYVYSYMYIYICIFMCLFIYISYTCFICIHLNKIDIYIYIYIYIYINFWSSPYLVPFSTANYARWWMCLTYEFVLDAALYMFLHMDTMRIYIYICNLLITLFFLQPIMQGDECISQYRKWVLDAPLDSRRYAFLFIVHTFLSEFIWWWWCLLRIIIIWK